METNDILSTHFTFLGMSPKESQDALIIAIYDVFCMIVCRNFARPTTRRYKASCKPWGCTRMCQLPAAYRKHCRPSRCFIL